MEEFHVVHQKLSWMDGLEASRETAEKCLGDQFHMMLLSNLKHKTRTSLAVQWLRLHASTAKGAYSVLDWGTKISHAMRHGQKMKNKFKFKTRIKHKTNPYKSTMKTNQKWDRKGEHWCHANGKRLFTQSFLSICQSKAFWKFYMHVFVHESESEVAQSCPTLCDPWTVAHQAPLSMGFSRQEYWSGLPFPRDLPNPGIKPRSLTLQADALTSA